MSIIFHIIKIEKVEDDLILAHTNREDNNQKYIFKLTRKKHKLFSEELIKYREYEQKIENAILNKYYFENELNIISVVNTYYNIKEDVVLLDPLELIYNSFSKNKYYAICMDEPSNDNFTHLTKFISSKICKNNGNKNYLKLYSKIIVNLTKLAKQLDNCNFHPDNFYINSKGQIKITNFERFINLYNSTDCSKWLKIQEKCKTLKKNQVLYTFLIKLIRKYYKNKKDTAYLYEYIQIYIELSNENIDIDEIFDSENVYDKIISTLNRPITSNIVSNIDNVQNLVSNIKKSDLEKMINLLGSDNKKKLIKILSYVKSSNNVLSNFINNIEKNLTK